MFLTALPHYVNLLTFSNCVNNLSLENALHGNDKACLQTALNPAKTLLLLEMLFEVPRIDGGAHRHSTGVEQFAVGRPSYTVVSRFPTTAQDISVPALLT